LHRPPTLNPPIEPTTANRRSVYSGSALSATASRRNSQDGSRRDAGGDGSGGNTSAGPSPLLKACAAAPRPPSPLALGAAAAPGWGRRLSGAGEEQQQWQ
jgi:hypothetical protein